MSRIAVIGGGIAGVSAAARLAALGPVTLIEAEPALAYHASGRSAAAFIEDYGNAVVRALNRASLPHLRTADGGVLGPRGALILARAGQDEVFEAEYRDFGMAEISVSDACAMVPILDPAAVARAAWRADVMDIDTDKMIQDFTRSARAKGARIVTGARIDAIERRDGRWLLGWPGGAEEAEILVNAAGSWADRIAVLAGARPLGLQPYRRSVAQIPAPEGRDCSGWPLFEGAGMEWYARPSGGKLWISPAEEDPMDPHDAFTDDMVVAEGLARYGDMVQVPVTRVETTWAGLRTFAPDRALVIGPDPGLPGFWWCAGQGGYGFQTAPAASRLLAQLIGGAAPELDADTVAALSPVRFS